MLALAESSRKRCQRLVLLKGERLGIWPYLHLRLQGDPWTISKEYWLTDCTNDRSLASRICLWHFLGSETCGILRISREGCLWHLMGLEIRGHRKFARWQCPWHLMGSEILGILGILRAGYVSGIVWVRNLRNLNNLACRLCHWHLMGSEIRGNRNLARRQCL